MRMAVAFTSILALKAMANEKLSEIPPFVNPPWSHDIPHLFTSLLMENGGKRGGKRCYKRLQQRKNGEIGFNLLAGLWYCLYLAIHSPHLLLASYTLDPFLREFHYSLHRSQSKASTPINSDSIFAQDPSTDFSDSQFWQKTGEEIARAIFTATGIRGVFVQYGELLHEIALQIQYQMHVLETSGPYLRPFTSSILPTIGLGFLYAPTDFKVCWRRPR